MRMYPYRHFFYCLIIFILIACNENLLGSDEELGGNEADQSGTENNSNSSSNSSSGSSSNINEMMCGDPYEEELPNMDVNIDDLVTSYNPQNASSFLVDALQQRYPVGAYLVENGMQSRLGDCVDFFLFDQSSAQSIIEQVSLLVHECGHFVDIDASGFSDSTYIITPDISINCTQGDTTSRGGDTFARSLLNNDDYALPVCQQGGGCDFYRDVYLDGDANNDEFEGGDQGYNSVLEETLQYINSIAVSYAFSNELTGRFMSERDGILTFLWYTTRYLRMARLDYPQAYERISGDACWRDLTLTLWDRAWFYLDASAGLAHLGIYDDEIEARLQPELLEEIDRLRALQCQ